MRLFFPILCLLLTACASGTVSDRRVPLDVREAAARIVDEVMAGDFDTVRSAFPDADETAFDAALSNMADQVRTGSEQARNLIAVQRSGSSISLAHEVQTRAGFTRISQTYALGDTPPRLTAIDVTGADQSLAAKKRRLGMAARIIGLAFLLGLIGAALAYIRQRRRA